ncbi:MAG: methyltransferase domain-containing protein [Pseudomonadota bacterium]
MAGADRERWDARYRNRDGNSLGLPSEWLLTYLDETAGAGRALDLACGAGRNALALAERGWRVDAVDVSPVALALGQQVAEARQLSGLRWIVADLETELPVAGPYELILIVRYLDRALLEALPALLAPGGSLLLELHQPAPPGQTSSGPRNPDYLITPDALRTLLAPLVLETLDSVVAGAIEKPEYLTRLRARRPADDGD